MNKPEPDSWLADIFFRMAEESEPDTSDVVMSSDFCTQCGSLVLVYRLAVDTEDGRSRPIVYCADDHWEIQT